MADPGIEGQLAPTEVLLQNGATQHAPVIRLREDTQSIDAELLRYSISVVRRENIQALFCLTETKERKNRKFSISPSQFSQCFMELDYIFCTGIF